jgi:hypothetical protein
MNPSFNPFGIIQGMGQVGQVHFYSAHGKFDIGRQEWVSPATRAINFNDTAYAQGGHGLIGNNRAYNGYPPHAYSPNVQGWLQAQLAEPIEAPRMTNPYNDSNRSAQARPYWAPLGPITQHGTQR